MNCVRARHGREFPFTLALQDVLQIPEPLARKLYHCCHGRIRPECPCDSRHRDAAAVGAGATLDFVDLDSRDRIVRPFGFRLSDAALLYSAGQDGGGRRGAGVLVSADGRPFQLFLSPTDTALLDAVHGLASPLVLGTLVGDDRGGLVGNVSYHMLPARDYTLKLEAIHPDSIRYDREQVLLGDTISSLGVASEPRMSRVPGAVDMDACKRAAAAARFMMVTSVYYDHPVHANPEGSAEGQDQAILRIFDNVTSFSDGFFVDLAAHDAVAGSNTRALESR